MDIWHDKTETLFGQEPTLIQHLFIINL